MTKANLITLSSICLDAIQYYRLQSNIIKKEINLSVNEKDIELRKELLALYAQKINNAIDIAAQLKRISDLEELEE